MPAKYRITGRLGAGGMCDVYDAEHVLIGKRVAIKVLRSQFAADPNTSRRFEQEARAASRIHHPNAINVTDVGITEDGSPFIVMEFVDGKTLDNLIRSEGPLGLERAANILRQTAGALEAAHLAGIIHRDIKPQNIIVSCVDGLDWVKVVDFGVSKALEDSGRSGSVTAANFIIGTPRYMSPEQCENAPIDARSDVYSLGVVLYEMLAGVPPFEDDSLTRLLVRHSSEPPRALRAWRPDLAPQVESVVMSALEKDPARRPQGAAELSELFDRAIGLPRRTDEGKHDRGRTGRRIEVPLGPDDATIIRQKAENAPMRPAGSSAHSAGDSLDQRYGTGQHSLPGGISDRYYTHQRTEHSGLVITLVALLVVAAGIAAYLYFNGMSSGSGAVDDSISNAQQSIADAIARVDSLPRDHPLRSYLPQLQEWQGELKAYSQMHDRSEEVRAKADQYKLKADQISGQARVAAAALARQANQNTNTPQPVPSGSSTALEQPGTSNKSANANREQVKSPPDQSTTNSNRPEEPRLPVKPQPSPPRPANSNSGG